MYLSLVFRFIIATIDSWLQSEPVVKIRTFFRSKGRKCVHTSLFGHVMNVYDADFFKIRGRLFADGNLEKKQEQSGSKNSTETFYIQILRSPIVCVIYVRKKLVTLTNSQYI